MSESINSQPNLTGFSPDVIPWQRQVMERIKTFDYDKYGVLEILLSGSYGSAKSILLAHIGITHCLKYPGARVCIARRSMPDLKRSIWREVLEHLNTDPPLPRNFFRINRSEMTITFRNGSVMFAMSWADGNHEKFRSVAMSMLLMEELTENDADDQRAYKEAVARLGRMTHIPQSVALSATNPDEEDHWAHEYFITPNAHAKHPSRDVYYSLTAHNPFLPRAYFERMQAMLSPREADRYLRGQWISLTTDKFYYAYDSSQQYLKGVRYEITEKVPIGISFDFNIAAGKPMSAILFQLIGDTYNFFSEAVLQGSRTADILDEYEGRGIFSEDRQYWIAGDASGKHADTRSSRSDYDIILKFFKNKNLRHTYMVPLSNPPIRKRHNRVNAYCLNDLGERRLYFYSGCEKADQGLRLVRPKPGGDYVEDDSKDYQHVTTAIGYAIVSSEQFVKRKPSGVYI